MADIILRSDRSQGKTSIPHYFIDKYMPRASGEYVKVYIYILRCFDDENMKISTTEIADRFDYTERSVIRALHYWSDEGLLKLSFNKNAEITGITLLKNDSYEETDESPAEEILHHSEAKAQELYPSAGPNRNGESLSTADRSELLQIAEMYIGRPLSTTEIEILYSWLDDLSLPSEVVDYVVDYSVTKGHDAFSYMNKIACDWSAAGIKTVDEAKRYSFDKDMQAVYRQIQNTYGITSRSLTPSEKDYIKKWMITMAMPLDLIINACERTIKNTGKVSFDYTDSILKSWHSKNALTIDAVSRLDSEYKTRFANKPAAASRSVSKKNEWNFEQRDYDMQSIEKKLLKKA